MIVLNTATLTGTYNWVYPLDPAFDREAEAYSEHELLAATESCDAARLQKLCKPGESPTFWRLQHLSGECRRWLVGYLLEETDLQNNSFSPMALRKAAAHGLCGVENLRDSNGSAIEFKQTEFDKESKQRVAPGYILDALDQIDGGAIVNMMGVAVIRSLTPQGN